MEIGGSGTGSEEKYMYLGSPELQHIAWPGTGDGKAGRQNSLVMDRGYYHCWICTVGDISPAGGGEYHNAILFGTL